MPRTDHNIEIIALRKDGHVGSRLSADLLQAHDSTSLSLDDWENATQFIGIRVERATGKPFALQKNGA